MCGSLAVPYESSSLGKLSRPELGVPVQTSHPSNASGRKNVLRKLLRIHYRRLKAGFSFPLIFLIKFLLHDVSFLWHDFFFSARLFFFGTTFFFWHDFFFRHDFLFGTTFFFWHPFFFRHDFFLARLFFYGTTFFGHDRFFRHDFFFWHDYFFFRQDFFGTNFFFRHDFLFSARPGQVTADQYYCSGMEDMVNSTVVKILGTRLLRSPV